MERELFFFIRKYSYPSLIHFSQKENGFSLRFSNQSYISYGTTTPTNSSYGPPASDLKGPGRAPLDRSDEMITALIQWKNFSLPFFLSALGGGHKVLTTISHFSSLSGVSHFCLILRIAIEEGRIGRGRPSFLSCLGTPWGGGPKK